MSKEKVLSALEDAAFPGGDALLVASKAGCVFLNPSLEARNPKIKTFT